ncbi:DAZ-associated protein 2 [Tetranychus urticae]|uniref:DAZ-associated protein 2 n=1 Tax=Tetranychus urticae TaxID=32264 RepID=T1K6G2_TETUR|nr:DAZ-associated protein 2 [Tetranychus urticae]
MGNNNSRGKKNSQSNQDYPARPQSAPLYPSEPPPPYTPTPQPPYQAHSMAYGMNHGPAPPRGYPAQTIVNPVVHAHFDSGARFDAISRPSIPPPPPGTYPNAAQMAVVSGHKVILAKKKTSFLGDKGAGYTFW